MTETLNEKALEAAHEAAGWDAPHNKERTAAAIRAYLSSLPAGDYAGLVERLNGIYRIPITDGLGAVGSGEEPDNPNEFVRKFDTAPIQQEAATAIAALVAERDALKAQVKVVDEALDPFADISDLIDSETEGMSETDELQLLFHDYLFASWPVSLFRRARAVKGGKNG